MSLIIVPISGQFFTSWTNFKESLPGCDVTSVCRAAPDSSSRGRRFFEAVCPETGFDVFGHLTPEVSLENQIMFLKILLNLISSVEQGKTK